MSDMNTDKKLRGKDLITIGIFSAIYFVINFAFMLLGRYPSRSLDADAWLYCCVCWYSIYADGSKSSKTGCSFLDGPYHCPYLLCNWTIYPGDPDLDGFYLHFG